MIKFLLVRYCCERNRPSNVALVLSRTCDDLSPKQPYLAHLRMYVNIMLRLTISVLVELLTHFLCILAFQNVECQRYYLA
jgi:hypothetical protein